MKWISVASEPKSESNLVWLMNEWKHFLISHECVNTDKKNLIIKIKLLVICRNKQRFFLNWSLLWVEYFEIAQFFSLYLFLRLSDHFFFIKVHCHRQSRFSFIHSEYFSFFSYITFLNRFYTFNGNCTQY